MDARIETDAAPAGHGSFVPGASATTGVPPSGPDGVTVTTGGADQLLHRLREAAAPGQILMSQPARQACEGLVDAVPVRTAPDGSIEAHVLRNVRPTVGMF